VEVIDLWHRQTDDNCRFSLP